MEPAEKNQARRVLCPYCASDQFSPVRKNYDGGLGCLGLILFGWWGLLLGLLGGGDVEMVCHNCGARWNPRGHGCFTGCLAAVFAIVAASAVIFLIALLLAAAA